MQTQVLPYLRQLAAGGVGVHLLTFEPGPWTSEELASEREHLASDGITWTDRAYHKSPSAPATAYDVLVGAWTAITYARRFKIDVLHARSHIPLAMALLARMFVNVRVIFDIRGLLAEEYVDIGNWTEGSLPFRMIKRLERVGLKRADQLVVLTKRMEEWLVVQHGVAREKITVIPCCTDVARFDLPHLSGSSDRLEVVYAGTATGLYLIEEVAKFFKQVQLREPRAYLRVLTHSSESQVSAVLKSVGIDTDDFYVGPASPEEVPAYFRRASIGVSFRKSTMAQIAASPAKIPEYLAAGLAVVSNVGIGDMDHIITSNRVGHVVVDFSEEALGNAATEILRLLADADLRQRCQQVARQHFDMVTVGGQRYLQLYRHISASLRFFTAEPQR